MIKNPLEEQLKNKLFKNGELAEELHKPIIKSIRKVYSSLGWRSCRYAINTQFVEGIYFLLCAIDISRKYTWVNPLNNKKGITITNDFHIVLDKSNYKLNIIWVDNGSEFYNRSMKS